MTIESRKLRLIFTLVCTVLMAQLTIAQQRLVDDVKRDLNSLTLKPKNYTDALTKLKPALTHEATKDKAEPWFVASNICFGFYDKSIKEKELGNSINRKTVGNMLIEGYRYAQQALTLDSVKQTRKDGTIITDKKTGRPRVKTKYSPRISELLLDHMVDFSAVGGDLFVEEDWKGAYQAWDIYCNLSLSALARKARRQEPDTIVGYYRYFQGLAAHQSADYQNAILQFSRAHQLGYRTKDVYDSWLEAAFKANDSTQVMKIAEMAFPEYGNNDPKYIRILINSYLRLGKYDTAGQLVDQAISSDSIRPEYLNLKGSLVERQLGPFEALPYYQRAVELSPENPHYRFDLGYCLYQQATQLGDGHQKEQIALFKQALPHIEKAYNLNQRNETAKKLLTRLYYLLGSKKIDRMNK